MIHRRTGRFLAVAVLALVVSCGAGPQLATVSEADLVGTWVDESGGRLEFAQDRTFRTRGLQIHSGIYPECPDGDAAGTWGFFVEEGDLATSSTDAVSGRSIALRFQGVEQGGCNLSADVVNGGKELCLTDDDVDLCGVGAGFSRRSGDR